MGGVSNIGCAVRIGATKQLATQPLVVAFFLKKSNFISYGRKLNNNHKKHKKTHPSKQKLNNHAKSNL